jgi:MFS family permease
MSRLHAPPGTPAPVLDLPDVAQLQRRVMRVVVTSQVLGGAGLAAGVTVGALLAQQMLGSTALAGLPAALFTGGSALAALGVGRLSDRFGRRTGLALGYGAGAVGGAGVVVAATMDSVAVLLLSLTVYGAGTATNLQARYAGADLAAPTARGRAVSTVLVATTLGAVAGPNLVDVTGDAAQRAGIPALAGPFALAAVAYTLAGLVLLVMLRPDPLVTAKRLAHVDNEPSDPEPRYLEEDRPASSHVITSKVHPGLHPLERRRTLATAAIAMVLTQLVMVAIMTMTPVHLREHGHGLSAVGGVIAVHIAAMYLPSPLTGWLADRFGRRPVLVAAGIVLLAAGVVAATAPTDSVIALAVALGMVGLGWNLGLIGGTAMVTDCTLVDDRARVQGGLDVGIAVAGATGGIASGAVVAASSYPVLALGGAALAVLVVGSTVLAAARGPHGRARKGLT